MRVGIVMPHYRHLQHLPDAVASITAQTFTDYEMVVVFDGPPYTEVPGHITIKVSRHVGTAGALNAGFDWLMDPVNIMPPDYLTWVSADNVMHPDWLEKMVAELDAKPELAAVYSSYVREDGHMTPEGWRRRGGRVFRRAPKPLIHSPDCYIGPAFLYRRELHEKVGEHRGGTAHDYDWWLRAEEHGRIGWLDEPLCTYRVHKERACVRQPSDSKHWQHEAAKRRRLRDEQAARPS